MDEKDERMPEETAEMVAEEAEGKEFFETDREADTENSAEAGLLGKESVLRLAKPFKTGFRHLIFSRSLIIILMIAFQVAMITMFYLWLNRELATVGAALEGLFTFVMVIYLFNMKMDSSAKLTWMFLIAILPLPGTIFFAFTQSNIGHRMLQAAVARNIDATRTALPRNEGVLKQLEAGSSGTEDLVHYLNRSGCFPAYRDNEVTYFPSGEKKFEAMLEDLKKAEHYIFLEYFIIEEGYMWGKILEILTEKVRQGVDVRVMYDGMCELFQLPSDYWKLLEKQGIRAKAFAPLRPVVSSYYNYRDHRKILSIDGKVAYTGGVNLADEYINRVERFGHWKDIAVRISGSAAQSFTLMFLQMWNVGETEKKNEKAKAAESGRGRHEKPDDKEAGLSTLMRDVRLLGISDEDRAGTGAPASAPERRSTFRSSGVVIPYCDCPLDGEKVGETVYMDILYRATDYVHIMTPYLILDGEMQTALCYAAERGIDVKIILPGIPDKKAAYALAKSHYRDLLASGVKLYEYTPGFVHAKLFVSDDVKAVTGTINLDYRSLYHHFECGTYLYRTDCIREMEQDFQETLVQCREVTPETVKNEKPYYRILGRILKFVAPLM